MKPYIHPSPLILSLLVLLGITACTDDWDSAQKNSPLIVEEGIEGTLSLAISSYDFENRVSALTRAATDAEDDEQHLHSIYLFVIDMKNEGTSEECPIIARKYISDVTGTLANVMQGETTWNVVNISMKALSCQTATIFAVANLGYSEMQHIENDGELLAQCDEATTLADLLDLNAKLSTDNGVVNVERMQGHHLMSGFYADFSNEESINYLSANKTRITLRANADDTLDIYDADGTKQFRPLGSTTGTPGAIILHRLDTKITFNIKPTGALATTSGAYFRLTSWQVKNAATEEKVHWYNSGEAHSHMTGDSKVFQRDISETDDAGWTFSYYQFENCATKSTDGTTAKGYLPISSITIANQYNMEYSRTDITAGMVESAFPENGEYPNDYSAFAYTLRDRQQKEGYDPATDDDETITVTNGGFDYAPETATYVELKGEYYNPKEPVRRSASDARNANYPLTTYPLDQYPYWNVDNIPVATVGEAATRTRTANVTYRIHLGYVGGGNQKRTTDAVPTTVSSFSDFESKVNDYNVLRNHHYTYEISISGVNNIKVEATREDGGNIYEQEKQTGAEGEVVESQHFYNLDAHYETRNLTFDFRRMPTGVDGYGFMISTPYQTVRAELKQKADGNYGIFHNGTEITGIRGLDLDWIHFAWHGTESEPHRSLIDADTGNGISYSKTYGGYTTQQTYNNANLTKEADSSHPYYLMNSYEFVMQVWEYYQKWIAAGSPTEDGKSTMTYTIFVDEYYYDNNPTNGANVDWMSFCNQSPRSAFFFMEGQKTSADQNSTYTDAHVAIVQESIQTPYATSTAGGQSIADVAFGIEHLDEFQAKYNRNKSYNHYFAGNSRSNGLYNAMNWFKNNSRYVIPWEEAEGYYTEKARDYTPSEAGNDFTVSNSSEERDNRRGAWTVYSRNRDLNRDGILDANEIRWFVPALDQYMICFLGGRPAFENPIYEASRAIKTTFSNYLHQVPLQHYMTSSSSTNNHRIYWAEEGCAYGNYCAESDAGCYGIRMARMLRRSGLDDTGSAFGTSLDANVLAQDPIFIVTRNRNGQAIDYKSSELTDGSNYYITLNKLNTDAFRDYIASGELAQHTHEQKNNWLYREYKIAKNKIGFTSWDDKNTYDRTPKVDGVSRTWWQLNGVWTNSNPTNASYYNGQDGLYYAGPTTSIAYEYSEDANGDDLHRWRIPNQREAALMNMAFPEEWFNCENGRSYCTRTMSDNLGPSYYDINRIPYFSVSANAITRIAAWTTLTQYVRPIHDVR